MKRVAIALFLLLLVGCFDSSSPDWQLSETGLSYKTTPVDFNNKALPNCEDCEFKQVTQHSPLGPSKLSYLYQQDKLIAAFGKSANQEITFPNNSGKTVFKVKQQNDVWQLQSDAQSYPLSENQVTTISVYGKTYQLLPLNLERKELAYIWLKQSS